MKPRRRTIGKLAAETGVNVETVRYYERRGLLRRPPSEPGGRHYSDEAVWLIRYVKIGQSWGLTLRSLADLLARAERSPNFCAAIRSAATDKIAEIDRQMAELEARRREIVSFVEVCSAKPDVERCPIFKRLVGDVV